MPVPLTCGVSGADLLIPEEVALAFVRQAYDRARRLTAALGPLVRLEVDVGPVEDVEMHQALSTELGRKIRALADYVQSGHGLAHDEVPRVIGWLFAVFSRDLEGHHDSPCNVPVVRARDEVDDLLTTLAHAAHARACLANEADLSTGLLGALAGMSEEELDDLVSAGELSSENRVVPHDEAVRWLRARRVAGL